MKVAEMEDLNGAETDVYEHTCMTEGPVYTVISEQIRSSVLGVYSSYGIAVIDKTGKTVRTVHDITCDRAALEKLVLLCNRLELAPCHLDDVIDDFLS